MYYTTETVKLQTESESIGGLFSFSRVGHIHGKTDKTSVFSLSPIPYSMEGWDLF